MVTLYVSKSGNDNTGNGSVESPYLTIQKAINVSSHGDTIEVGPGSYSEQIAVNKSITLNGAQKDVNAINEDGTIRNASESIVQGNNSGSGCCFTITVSNVIINGFKCLLPATNLVRDGFNLKNTPAGQGNTATLKNITIKNNIIQNLRTSGQSQAILFGESTTNSYSISNGNGLWENIEINNNYLDISSVTSNGYRGIQFSTHFKVINFTNINIHHNRFIHSANIISNRAIGLTSYISDSSRGPSYLNNFKINNNYFNTPGNSAIGGLADCDSMCQINNNIFMNCKYAIASVNFKENGGEIKNNEFTVSEYAIGITNNRYATTNGSDITIINNIFNGSPVKYIESTSDEVDFSNLQVNNTFDGYVLKSLDSSYQQYDNGNNPVLNRTTRSIYPTIQKGIDASGNDGNESIIIGPGIYNENIVVTKSITINGSSVDNTLIQSASGHTVTVNANNVTINTCEIKSTVSGGRAINIINNSDTVNLSGLKVSATGGNSSYGIVLDNANPSNANSNIIKNVSIVNCDVVNSGNGIKVPSFSSVDGLTITNSRISNNLTHGIYADTTGTANNFSPKMRNVNISNCNFMQNGTATSANHAAIFAEKLEMSRISNCTFQSKQVNGTTSQQLIQLSIKKTTEGQNENGSNITITGCTFDGSGNSSSLTGLYIHGRNDGTYSTYPGSISNLDVSNNTYTNLGRGILLNYNILDNPVDLGSSEFQNNIVHIVNWKTDPNFNINASKCIFKDIHETNSIDHESITHGQRFALVPKVSDSRTILKSGYMYSSNNTVVKLQESNLATPITAIATTNSIIRDNGGRLEVAVQDMSYSSDSGVAYGTGVGYAGVLARFTIEAFNNNEMPITDLSSAPLVLNVNLPHANPTSILKIYKLIKGTNDVMKPQPAGYPVQLTYVSGTTWSLALYSLSDYQVKDEQPPLGSAGGDPHVKMIDGTKMVLPNEWKYVSLYDDNTIKVCGKCEFIGKEVASKLHYLTKMNTAEQIVYRPSSYVNNYTYFVELDIYKNDKLCIKIDTINGTVLYNNKQLLVEKLFNEDSGIYSVSHDKYYPPQNFVSYCVHLLNNNYIMVSVDNFWDEINDISLVMNNKINNVKGAFIKHSEDNSLPAINLVDKEIEYNI